MECEVLQIVFQLVIIQASRGDRRDSFCCRWNWENASLFGDAFKKILLALIALALLCGAALGILFALRGEIPRNTEAVNMPEPATTAAPTDRTIDTPEPVATPEPEPVTAEEWVERYLATMGTQEKLGQLVMFGFTGTSDVTETFRDIWTPYYVGNAVLYGSQHQKRQQRRRLCPLRRLNGEDRRTGWHHRAAADRHRRRGRQRGSLSLEAAAGFGAPRSGGGGTRTMPLNSSKQLEKSSFRWGSTLISRQCWTVSENPDGYLP